MSERSFCFNTGQCCRNTLLKLTGEELNLIEAKTGTRLPTQNLSDGRFLFRGSCPFISQTNLCTIYEFRPTQCRLYHCGRIQGPEDPVRKTIGEIKQLMAENPEYKAWKIKTEDEAVAWGNEHGWRWRR